MTDEHIKVQIPLNDTKPGPDQCSFRECPARGRWYPVILYRVHQNHTPGELVMRLKLCDEHKAQATVATFLSEEMWQVILRVCDVLKLAAPTRWLTTLDWKDGETWSFPNPKEGA